MQFSSGFPQITYHMLFLFSPVDNLHMIEENLRVNERTHIHKVHKYVAIYHNVGLALFRAIADNLSVRWMASERCYKYYIDDNIRSMIHIHWLTQQ